MPATFESRLNALRQEGGAWFARDLMTLFGYQDWDAFKGIIRQAEKKGVPAGHEGRNFQPVTRNVNGQEVEDFQVTPYGCLSLALNSDRNIPAAAEAQDYFVAEVRYEIEDFIEWR